MVYSHEMSYISRRNPKPWPTIFKRIYVTKRNETEYQYSCIVEMLSTKIWNRPWHRQSTTVCNPIGRLIPVQLCRPTCHPMCRCQRGRNIEHKFDETLHILIMHFHCSAKSMLSFHFDRAKFCETEIRSLTSSIIPVTYSWKHYATRQISVMLYNYPINSSL